MKTLSKRHAGSPLLTNAACNRAAATRAFKAGLTVEQIVQTWPEVFTLTDGKLGQKYDYELADGSGRYETNRRITDDSVDAAIVKYVRFDRVGIK